MKMKLTLKQLMLIIMSVLLVLTVVMSSVVVAKVRDMVDGMGSGSGDKPPVVGGNPTDTQQPTPDSNQGTPSDPTETTAPTQPPVTDPDHEHDYKKSQTVAATCTDMGYTIYLCSCGKSDIRDFHNAKGHNYGEEEYLEATCETSGYRRATCRRCGAVDTREVFEALEHDYQLVKSQEQDCVQDGYDEYQCTHCEDVKRENKKKAKGHNWIDSEVLEEPTDVKPGKTKKTCVEGCEETIITAPTGDLSIQYSNDPKEENGWTEYIFKVGTADNREAYTYIIWIAGDHTNFRAVFSEAGLTISYTDADKENQQHILEAYDDVVLVIDVDGNTSDEIPDLSQNPDDDPEGETDPNPDDDPEGDPDPNEDPDPNQDSDSDED